jgi:hypothetical protein
VSEEYGKGGMPHLAYSLGGLKDVFSPAMFRLDK